MVMINNPKFVESAVAELQRCKLGPFASDATPTELERLERFEEEGRQTSTIDAQSASGPPWLRTLLEPLPAMARPFLFWGLVVLAVSLGIHIESGDSASVSFGSLLLRNFAILGIFAGVVMTQKRIERWTQRDGFAWLVALGLLVLVGSLTSDILS
jgi:hypothetical protein